MPFKYVRNLFRRSNQQAAAHKTFQRRSRIRQHLVEQLEDRKLLAVDSITAIGIAQSENFDGMAATTALPTGWRVLGGTSPTYTAGSGTVTAQASSGSPTAGGTYNFGSSGSERAVGAMTSGSFASPNSYMVQVTNNTGSTIDKLTIGYAAERYRINTASASIQFFYSTNGTAWQSITAGDLAASNFPTGASSYTFASGLRITSSGIDTPTGLNLANGSNIYFRWNINTTGANSQGIAIDDITVLASSSSADTTPPLVTSIDDGDADDLVVAGNTLSYTVTFNEDINETTVTGADFNNAGTSSISIGTISETSPGVFSVQVTANSAGTLQLRIPSGAIIQDVAGNSLVTPVVDDTTLTVAASAVAPTVTSPTSSSITDVSAILGGNVTSDGGASVTERGVLYALTSVNANPQLNGTGVTKVTATGTTGVFTASATGLTAGSAYSFVAYATNGAGTTYTTPVSTFSTTAPSPTLAPGDLAILGRINNTTPDTFAVVPLVNLQGNTVVYFTDNGWTGTAFRGASATDGDGNENLMKLTINSSVSAGTVINSNDTTNAAFTWTKSGSIPGTTTGTFADLSLATSGDQITAFQGPTSNPMFAPTNFVFTLDDTNGFEDATDAASGSVATGLTAGSTAITFAASTGGVLTMVNDGATRSQTGWLAYASSFSNWSTSATSLLSTNLLVGNTAPVVGSPTASGITATDATLGGTVSSDGGSAITERGILYAVTGVNSNPQLNGTGVVKVTSTGTTGTFTIAATGLLASTGYSFVAYATNAIGTTYSTPVSTFTTNAPSTTAPTVTSPTSTAITQTTVTLGGNVVADGGAAISERGIVYSLTSVNSAPQIGGTGVTKITNAGTTGVFTVDVTGLTAGTGYSFAAYATNNAGTTYATSSFSTLAAVAPTVSSPTFTNVSDISATLGGTVVSDGGASITERGILFAITSVNANPQLNGTGVTKLTSAGTTGVFTTSTSTLTAGTNYSFVAFATNSAGTTYSAPVSTFTTNAASPALTAGDIAILGRINNGTPDSFVFVPLVDLQPNTVIYFTDNGWTGTEFRGVTAADGDGNEGLIKFTANQTIAAGTVINTSATSSTFTWTKSGSIPGTTTGVFAELSFATAGDQITAFQGPTLNPMLVPSSILFTLDDTNGFENATDSATGNVATGLTSGTTALTFGPSPLSGSFTINNDSSSRNKSGWLSYFGNAANWTAASVGTLLSTNLSVVNLTTPTITATPSTKVYDGSPIAVSATADDGPGGAAADSANFTYTYYAGPNLTGGTLASAPKNVGNYSVDIAYAGNSSYSAVPSTPFNFSITAKALTATATASNKIYDRLTDATVAISLGGVISGDTVTGSATGTFDSKNVGTGKTVTVGTVTLAGADAGNYTVGSAGTTTANITAKALTASATASNKVYDRLTDATIAITLGGVISGDTVTGTATGTFADKNVGTGKTVTVGTVTLAGADASNYTVGSAGTTTANISAQSLTASATASNKTYDRLTDATVAITLGGVISGDTVTGSATGTFDTKNVGTGKTVTVGTVTLAGADAGNYTVGSAGSTTANITAKSLTASATASNKIYDGLTDATVAIALGGVISGDTVTGSATGTFDTKNVGTGKTVTVGTVTLGGIDAGNYTVGSAGTTTANISAKGLTVVADSVFKSVGQSDPAFTFSATGFANNETIASALTGALTRDTGESVGVYTIRQGTLTALNGNYTISFTTGTLSILSPIAVSSYSVNAGAAQRSMLTSISLTFNTPVTLTAGAFSITNIGLTTVQNIPLSQSQIIVTPAFGTPSTTFTITFGAGSGVQTRASGGNSLLDGNYRLDVDATKVVDAVQRVMPTNAVIGATAADKFFRLYGDIDGNGAVDAVDYIAARNAFASPGNYNAAFDINGDGVLSASESTSFTLNFGKRRRVF
ncbi:MAG: YDG domain-containing protein [Pirellulales bacterium]